MKKCLFFQVLFGVIFAININAATVSFLVIETGLPPETGINQHSVLWENGLLDVFFEAGHIVSNAPIKRLNSKPMEEFPREAMGDLNDAREGGAEFFILALLEYNGVQAPDKISLRMFKLNPYKKIFEQQHNGKRSNSTREEYDGLTAIIRGLVPHLR